MAVTETSRFRLPQWSAGTDPYPGRTGFNNILRLLEDQAAIAYPSGPIGSRPQSGTFGRFYLATDQGTPANPVSRLYYDGGSGWVEINTNGGGGPGTRVVIGGTPTEGISSRSARADHTHDLPYANSTTAGALSPQHYDLLAGATATATAGQIPRRTSSGQLIVPTTPGGSTDATSKSYVDAATADIRTASYLVRPGELVRRWSGSGSNGTIHVPDPTGPSDACNKRYADDLGSASYTGFGGAIVRRWGSEHVSGPDPDKPEFYATKRYVDARVSRQEWKTNEEPIPYGRDEVTALAARLMRFDYRDTEDVPASVRGETGHLGAYVADVADIMPGLTVDSEDDGLPERIKDRELIWPALRAIGQLSTALDAATRELEELREQVNRLTGQD